MILADTFVDQFEKYWTGALRPNISTPKLREVWRALGQALNEQVERVRAGVESWQVFPGPAGSGKTQGLMFWLSMLPDEGHPGALVVIRETDEADRFVATLNDVAGRRVAVAFHTGKTGRVKRLADLADVPVLAVTHEMYERGLDALTNDDRHPRWKYLHAFRGGVRQLIVVDEALDIVRENVATRAGLDRLVAAISPAVERKHRLAFQLVRAGAEALRAVDGHRAIGDAERELIAGVSDDDVRVALLDLREEVPDEQRTVISGLVHVLATWRWYFAHDGDAAMHTAKLLIPEGVTSALVLDATAKLNPIYKMAKFDFVPIPEDARNFDPVTLFDARTTRTGKHTTTRDDVAEAMQNVAAYYGRAARERKVLAIITKDRVTSIDPWRDLFGQVEVGWWNALDGKNGWRDFNTVVVLTLLYRPESVALNIFQAVHGPLATDGLTAPPGIVQEIREGQIAVDVVPAVNRVRCRAVTQPDGRCEPTDIWMRCPDTVRLVDPDRILDGLRLAMPGIVVRPWDLGGAGSGSRLRNQYEDTFIAWLGTNVAPGQQARAAEVRVDARIPQKVWTGFMRQPSERLVGVYRDLGIAVRHADGGQTGTVLVGVAAPDRRVVNVGLQNGKPPLRFRAPRRNRRMSKKP